MADPQTIIGGVAVVIAGAGVLGIFRMSHQLATLVARFDAHLQHNAEEHRQFRADLRVGEARLVQRLESGLKHIRHAG